MQSYTTIIGVLDMRDKKFSYRDIRARYGLGQGTIKLILDRFEEFGLPSPPLAYTLACRTSDTASGIVMKYLIIFGSVTVTGPPASICFLKSGVTEPLYPKTFQVSGT